MPLEDKVAIKTERGPMADPAKGVFQEEEARELLQKFFAEHPELEEPMGRAAEHLYCEDDITLVVLKGHLLIEDSLMTIIRKFVPHGEFINEARLGFFQKVQIARSLSWDEHRNEAWELALKLNRVRNDMAHALEHPKVEDHIRALRTRYFEIYAAAEEIQKKKGDPDTKVLKDIVSTTLGFLAAFEMEVERFRRWVGIMDRFMNPHRRRRA